MSMTSVLFFAVMGISFVFYWLLPKKLQWVMLFLDSLLFYFANATYYTFIYVCVSVMSVYLASRYFLAVGDSQGAQKKKKRVLLTTLLLNIGILAVLKYVNFAINAFDFLNDRFFNVEGISDITWIAPLAVSYYTLQLVSYLLDCYWGMVEGYANPLRLGLYTIYFPLMTCGPICRYDDLGEQLFEEHCFDFGRVKSGVYRIIWGLLKKIALADRLAVIVNQMWDTAETSTGINMWIGVMLFAVQLYTDFSGCMDIALGVSECFGIILPENFRAPFYSRNMQEFWRRWHITLGTWLRDYVMNPVLKSELFVRFGDRCKKRFGKKNGRKIPVYFAMLVLWCYMGVWHGNSWKYIIGEGMWFWLVIVLGQIFAPGLKKAMDLLHIKADSAIWHIFQSIRTFVIFSVGMFFFRAESLPAAVGRISASCHIRFDTWFHDIREAVNISRLGGVFGIIVMLFCFIMVMLVDYRKYKNDNMREWLDSLHWGWRCIIFIVMIMLLCVSVNVPGQGFIYAQF